MLHTFTRKSKVSSYKLSRLLVNVSLNLTQFITRSSLAYSVANNDRRFFSVLIFHKTVSTQYRYQKQEDIMKGNFELETTRHIKNCINFIRRYEIYRVWDVSLSHCPSQRLRVFATLSERLYFAKRRTTMSPQSLIELICGLTRRQESPGIPQTLNLRKSPLQIPVLTIAINAKY